MMSSGAFALQPLAISGSYKVCPPGHHTWIIKAMSNGIGRQGWQHLPTAGGKMQLTERKGRKSRREAIVWDIRIPSPTAMETF